MVASVPIDSEDIVRECVAAATLAPSSHNTQPWRFRQLRNTLDLIADRTRALPANDPYDRELLISCGAALFNLRVAATARSWSALVDEFPFADDEDLLARITFVNAADQSLADARPLAEAIPLRQTYRKRFSSEPVTQDCIDALVLAAEREGCRAQPISGATRRDIAAEIVSDADQIEWADPVWRREISAWMHPRRKDDGFSVPGLSGLAAQLVARTFDLGAGLAAQDRQILDGTPLLLLIGSPADNPADWLRTGQALQRVLLTACDLGLQASFLNQPIHIERLRQKLRELAADVLVPQILLRMGKPLDRLSPATRRPLAAVFDIDPLER